MPAVPADVITKGREGKIEADAAARGAASRHALRRAADENLPWDRLPACQWCCLTGWKPIPRVRVRRAGSDRPVTRGRDGRPVGTGPTR